METGGADQWVSKWRGFLGFARVYSPPCPWDTHYQFSIKKLYSQSTGLHTLSPCICATYTASACFPVYVNTLCSWRELENKKGLDIFEIQWFFLDFICQPDFRIIFSCLFPLCSNPTWDSLFGGHIPWSLHGTAVDTWYCNCWRCMLSWHTLQYLSNGCQNKYIAEGIPIGCEVDSD